MRFNHVIFRYLAIYVAIAMCTLTPLAGIGRAEAAINTKTLVIGGLVGGAALLALGALSGPAGIIGSVGAAGTGFGTIMGGAVGGLAGGTTGTIAGFGTLGTVALGVAGLFLGAQFLGPALASISPFILVPAVLVGAGLLVYSFINRQRRYGTVYDQRFRRPSDDPLWSAQSRLANTSETGAEDSQGGFLDRFRSIVDRNRRDDVPWWNKRYVDNSGYLRYNTDIWGKLDQFLNGKNGAFAYNDARAYGIGSGNTQYLDPGSSVRTDQSGRVTGGILDQSATRYGLSPRAPESETAKEDPDVEEALKAAEARRKAAYQKLVSTLKRKKSQTPSAEAPGDGTPGLNDPEVLEAIREYREADREIKELTERLQPREKQ